MSAIQTGIPPIIEQHLLTLDKQLRDAGFVRGVGRVVFGVCLALGACLLLDGLLDLNREVRICLLAGWFVIVGVLLWRGLIRNAFQPISLSALAALVEQRFPELRERLTSLVELRGTEDGELAPGASKVMQELLARQTLKALDQVSINEIDSTRGSARAVFAGLLTLLLLLTPFCIIPQSYSLLWSRLFLPWGNYGWGTTLNLHVLEGDQIVARGKDVGVHVSVSHRTDHHNLENVPPEILWLNWIDENGASDIRRMDWDDESRQFVTTLSHVQCSLTFEISTDGAKSRTYRIDVSDPPSMTQVTLDVEPAAYTGLPARRLMGLPREIRVPELTHIRFMIEFNEPVMTAEVIWPITISEERRSTTQSDQIPNLEQSFALDLTEDRRSGSVSVIAARSGQFPIRLKNQFGLFNDESPYVLIVDLDQPPRFNLDKNDDSIFCRPDEVVELPIDVTDDFGLTAVELHVDAGKETSTILEVPADQRSEPHVAHTFALDMTRLELNGDQTVTYRFRAADNRPQPGPHIVWSPFRSLVTSSSLKRLSDQQLAREEERLEDELSHLRTAVNKLKADVAQLHLKTEKEALNTQSETDKTEQLNQLQQIQDDLIEQLQQFADRLADRPITKNLASLARQIADDDLRAVNDRLEQAKNQPARNQLEPIAQAIDHLGAADGQLRKLEQQLNELHKLEQDLAELKRMAVRAEKLADQLDQIDADRSDQPTLDRLKADARSIGVQMSELLTKHPELMDAARRDQLHRLDKIADQAQQLLERQTRLAESLKQSASKDLPASKTPAEVVGSPASSDSKTERQAGHKMTAEQARLASDATKQALDLAREVGADSDVTKSATDFARQADEARQQAETGQLEQAAKAARQAAHAANETARQLNPEGQSDSMQSQQAQKLAQQQDATAQKFEQLAKSPEATRGAQQQGQHQVATAAKRLAEQLGRVSQSLKSDPVNSPKDATAADQSKETMRQAEQSMAQAEQAVEKNHLEKAANEATDAAEKLKQVANSAKPLSRALPASSPVPNEVGTRTADLKRRLDSAQQELSQCECNQPGANPNSTSSHANQLDGQRPEPSPFARTAEQFRKFAAMIKQQSREPNQIAASSQATRGQAKSEATSGASTPESTDPSEAEVSPNRSEGGGTGSGVNTTADLSQLDAELRQQAHQNWGRLPGKLRTEILQGAGKKLHPEYTQQIKSYFEEITKPK